MHSSDLDKLALASSLLISWLGENLRKLNEEQHVEMVSEIFLSFLHTCTCNSLIQCIILIIVLDSVFRVSLKQSFIEIVVNNFLFRLS